MPDLTIESLYPGTIAGVDEAGRGCWAGPVVAAAVVFHDAKNLGALAQSLNDSKVLSAKKREALFKILPGVAAIGVGQASVTEIDDINILQASLLAMRRAIEALPLVPQTVLVDGNKAPQLPMQTVPIVDGDAKSLTIAAASIIAKVTRDQMMASLAKDYPLFGWEKNAGYGTKTHREALNQNTLTPHHRRSFKPVKKLLGVA